MQILFLFSALAIFALTPIQIYSQTSTNYSFTWNDSTKTITFTVPSSGSGIFQGKFMKTFALGSRYVAGKYRQPITSAPHTIDILVFDEPNSPDFIGTFSFQTDAVGPQVKQMPLSAAPDLQNGISQIFLSSLPNPPDPVFIGLAGMNIQANPTATKSMVVRIFNYSEFALSIDVSMRQMASFSPSASSIPIKGYINLQLQFVAGNVSQTGVLNVIKQNDATKQFHIRAMVVNNEMKVYVDWATMATQTKLMMSPPPLNGVQNIPIGLYAGSVYSLGIFRSESSTAMAALNQATWKQDWMYYFREFLNSQKINKMKIPGTHDAASNNFASQAMDYFGKTQTQTITQQLNSGMRSFDLRVQKATLSNVQLRTLLGVSLNSYYVTHGALLVGSSVSMSSPISTAVLLTSVLAEFRAFSDSHRNEVIILNFHQMIDSSLTSVATQATLISQIQSALTGRMVPRVASDSTYGQIIETHAHPMRLIVSYNEQSVTNNNFWEGVSQIAPNFQSSIPTRTQIFDHIKQQYDTNTYTGLSSAQAAQFRADFGPMSMYYEVEEFCSRLDVYQKLNICHADFTENGFLVQVMISMNGIVSYKPPSPVDTKEQSAIAKGMSVFIIGMISMLLFSSEYI